MSFYVYFIFVINLVLSIVLYGHFKRSVGELLELDTCPFCYGTDACPMFEGDAYMETASISDFIFNYVSVKNVYFIRINDVRFVLKKLAHASELNLLDPSEKNYTGEIHRLLQDNGNFKTCGEFTTGRFHLDVLSLNSSEPHENFLKQTWTILQMNIEPILLQILQGDGWPIPKYMGACGRAVLEEYCGRNLNEFADYDWKDRAYLTLQLLQAALDFTDKHHKYRFYLTDVSPDNVAVSDALKVTFVDLENVIVSNKSSVDKTCVHESEFFIDEELVFSERNICESCLSDHNVYVVCRYLLSDDAPWPMMQGGLLHSPPLFISRNYNKVFVLMKFCVRPNLGMNRFEIAQDLIGLLHKMLFKEALRIV